MINGISVTKVTYSAYKCFNRIGNVKENDLGAGGDKSLFVTAGGTLEIHGAPKLSWTKLTKTAEKMDSTSGVFVQQRVTMHLNENNDIFDNSRLRLDSRNSGISFFYIPFIYTKEGMYCSCDAMTQ